jgi:beta-glucosidase
VPAAPDAGADAREARIDALLAQLDLDEKVAMLSGHGFFEAMAADGGRYCARPYHIGAGNERLGIPPLLFLDGPRGVAMGSSTCFPVSMARGASFDVDLEERIGDAIGRELRAHGANLFGGVCINLLRHPAWGRAQETYGEDPFLLGEMGAALVRGVQRHNVVATVKHFAANSLENARFHVDVRIDERALREVYLRHFERCVDAGAGAVMSAYNRVNGAYCGHSEPLLTEVLKGDWGFDGFVLSDFVLGCRGWDAFGAGLDVEAPDTLHYGPQLRAAVERGEVSRERLDDGVRRVLRSLFRTRERPDPERYHPGQIACSEHVALAREAAAKGVVLLENRDALPWDPARLRRLLVVGRLAAEANFGDHGSSRVYPPEVVTPLDGLRAAVPASCSVVHDDGRDGERLRRLAGAADAVLVVAGTTWREEGEFIPGQGVDLAGDAASSVGGDRVDLTLGKDAEALIGDVAAANPNTVVAVMAGSAVLVDAWADRVAGLLLLFYPGMAGGAALADVLFGRVNPSGRLPFSIPRRADDLPHFDRDATSITYDLWHGYTKLERDGVAPAYAFGFGRSYTAWRFEAPGAACDEARDVLTAEVDVVNAGARAGESVVQVYAGRAAPDPEHPRKRLCGFRRVALAPGERCRVQIDVPLRALAHFDTARRAWCLDAAPWRVWVGGSSAEADCVSAAVVLPARRWPLRER